MTTVERAIQATSTSIEERVLVVCELAETGWGPRGLPLPEYTRGDDARAGAEGRG